MLLVNVAFPTLLDAQSGIGALGEGGFVCTAAYISETLEPTVQVESDLEGSIGDTVNIDFATALAAAVQQSGGVISDRLPRHRVGWLPQARHAHQPTRFKASR